MASLPGWAKLTLIASLTANLFVVGYLAGGALGEGEKRQRGPLRMIMAVAPDDQRDFTQAYFEEIRPELLQLRAERRAHMESVLEAIRREPYSPSEVKEIFARQREFGTKRRMMIHERLATLLEEYDDQQREVFAANLASRFERRLARATQ
ncbi:MAG: periplasmic heavy metal sensor [Pseudomonadota bacterium]